MFQDVFFLYLEGFVDSNGTNGVLYVLLEKGGKIKFTYPLKSAENDKICTL